MIDLKNNIVVVTGGEGLLGSVFVRHCREAGAVTVSADIRVPTDLAKGTLALDATSEESVRAGVDAVVRHHGRIDGWVNNAYPRGKDFSGPFSGQSQEGFLENLDKHLGGYALCSRIVLEQMRTQGSGSLINMGSIYGCVAPDPHLYEGMEQITTPVVYAAIKGGVIQMTRALAAVYGQYGVRVNAVSPGGIENQHPKEFIERYARKTALGRMGKPEDIAPAIVFLLSESARYITGANLLVDGGMTAL
ncbi:MAG: SDR family oxidoreductase [Candidatus Peribacteraceae bacterium]|nr:SDR family oxidoreductase [Candidatus Peribacteraceae bacterium]MDD5741920.1 SDR family oxidoreductase [Candidatus Peribacteraceae bacterium]